MVCKCRRLQMSHSVSCIAKSGIQHFLLLAGSRGTSNVCGDSMTGNVQVFGRRLSRDTPHAQRAGVQKAPRHEVAGSWAVACSERYGDLMLAPSLDGGRDANTTPPSCLPHGGRESVVGILAGVWIASTRDPCTDGCDWVGRDRRRRGAGAFGRGRPQRSQKVSGS
jgi:hypothetical protein